MGKLAKRVVAIVGNAPFGEDRSAEIDRADVVVRINNAYGFGGRTGRKVSQLVLVNCGGQMSEWLSDASLEAMPAFRAARSVVLPIHAEKAAFILPPLNDEEWLGVWEQDYTAEARARCLRAGKIVIELDAAFFLKAMREIGYPNMRRRLPAPSTGYLTARWWVAQRAREPLDIVCYGFGFDGWDGHDWEAERSWFEESAAAGHLIMGNGPLAQPSARAA